MLKESVNFVYLFEFKCTLLNPFLILSALLEVTILIERDRPMFGRSVHEGGGEMLALAKHRYGFEGPNMTGEAFRSNKLKKHYMDLMMLFIFSDYMSTFAH